MPRAKKGTKAAKQKYGLDRPKVRKAATKKSITKLKAGVDPAVFRKELEGDFTLPQRPITDGGVAEPTVGPEEFRGVSEYEERLP